MLQINQIGLAEFARQNKSWIESFCDGFINSYPAYPEINNYNKDDSKEERGALGAKALFVVSELKKVNERMQLVAGFILQKIREHGLDHGFLVAGLEGFLNSSQLVKGDIQPAVNALFRNKDYLRSEIEWLDNFSTRDINLFQSDDSNKYVTQIHVINKISSSVLLGDYSRWFVFCYKFTFTMYNRQTMLEEGGFLPFLEILMDSLCNNILDQRNYHGAREVINHMTLQCDFVSWVAKNQEKSFSYPQSNDGQLRNYETLQRALFDIRTGEIERDNNGQCVVIFKGKRENKLIIDEVFRKFFDRLTFSVGTSGGIEFYLKVKSKNGRVVALNRDEMLEMESYINYKTAALYRELQEVRYCSDDNKGLVAQIVNFVSASYAMLAKRDYFAEGCEDIAQRLEDKLVKCARQISSSIKQRHSHIRTENKEVYLGVLQTVISFDRLVSAASIRATDVKNMAIKDLHFREKEAEMLRDFSPNKILSNPNLAGAGYLERFARRNMDNLFHAACARVYKKVQPLFKYSHEGRIDGMPRIEKLKLIIKEVIKFIAEYCRDLFFSIKMMLKRDQQQRPGQNARQIGGGR